MNIINFVTFFNKPKNYLILINILLVFFAILLTNLGILPFKNFGDFVFFAVIGLALALYRPGWAFLFFIGTIALENINVAPKGFPLDIRPYQFFGALTIIALAIRYFSGRLNFKLAKLKWFDYALIIFAMAGFASAVFSADKGLALKQSVVLLSYVFLYLLIRNYIQTLSDLKKIIPFFLSSSIIVFFYGIWQNIAFMKGLNSFEAMPGRPNATFTEADWLGIFLVLLLAVIYSLIYYCHFEQIPPQREESRNLSPAYNETLPYSQNTAIMDSRSFDFVRIRTSLRMTGFYLLLIPVYILLILTVSRSAWLGAGAITIIFLKIVLTQTSWHLRDWKWKEFSKQLGLIISAGIISLLIVYIFHLTNFQLFNRVESTGTGLQKITVSCAITDCASSQFDCAYQKELKAGDAIKSVDELKNYACRHINLEDIEKEKSLGMSILEVYRPDPNVNIRSQIYQKSWQEIKNHPIIGIGWGSIGKILGTDERGTSLNSSNIFLEVWLGSGIIGFLAFLTILGYLFIQSIRYLINDDLEPKIIGLFAMLGFMAIIIPNLFNAGIYLGILWAWLGITLSLIDVKKT